ncbi:retrovirus-related pol polyprotein from transposon TNT 1-94 [Tanacetum coccineum]
MSYRNLNTMKVLHYQFQIFVPSDSTVPKLQTAEDLQGDALLHYDAEMELMNLILLSIPNEIYNSFVAEPGEALVSIYNRFAQLMNDLERNKMIFPIVTVNTKFLNSLQPEWLKYVTQKSLMNQQDDVQTNSEDPLASAMLLLARAITQNFSNPTNNRLRTSSNTRFQAIIQGDRVNIQSKNSVEKDIMLGIVQSQEFGIQSISWNTVLLGKQDEVGVILTDEQNDFLFDDASRMEEIKEISVNICLMARIQPANNTSDAGPSYDFAFISIMQQFSTARTPQQNGVAERRNRTLVEADRTMLSDADEFNQEDSADFNGNLDFVPYNALSHEEIESSMAALEPSNVQNFHQVQPLTHIWTKDHPLG